MSLVLRVQGGSLGGRTRALGPDEVAEGILIGHGADCGVRFDALRDPAIAKHHAMLLQRDAELVLLDLAGQGDVLVDGRAVPESGAPVGDGGRIQIGRHGPTIVLRSQGVGLPVSPPPVRLVRSRPRPPAVPATRAPAALPVAGPSLTPAAAPVAMPVALPIASPAPVPVAMPVGTPAAPVEAPSPPRQRAPIEPAAHAEPLLSEDRRRFGTAPTLAAIPALTPEPPAPVPSTGFALDAPAPTWEAVAGFVPGELEPPSRRPATRRSGAGPAFLALLLAAATAGGSAFEAARERAASDAQGAMARRRLEAHAAEQLGPLRAELESTRARVARARAELVKAADATLPFGPPPDEPYVQELLAARSALVEAAATLQPAP